MNITGLHLSTRIIQILIFHLGLSGLQVLFNDVVLEVNTFKNFIEIQLLYNAVLISVVHKNYSVMRIYTYIFFFTMVYHRILNIIPCAIQQDLVYSFVYIGMCMLSHVQLFCNPMDCSSPGFFVHGILQARTLEWVAISFSRGSP